MANDHAGGDVGEFALRVDGIKLAGFHQRCDRGQMRLAAVEARKKRILAIEVDRPDRTARNYRDSRNSRPAGGFVSRPPPRS